ncbi:MAG: sigma-54-dependent transcriptional regulator [Acidobacteriota bacterium]
MLGSQRPRAIVVDDHADLARLITENLTADGWDARALDSGRGAIAAIGELPPQLVITDLRMPERDGFAVLDAAPRDAMVIVMTGFGDVPSAVEAMNRGAWHFVEKPVRMTELVGHARRARELRRDAEVAFAGIVGASAPMQQLASSAARVARTSAAVLLRGESGTGKELVARAIHAASPRRDRPFVAINCAGIPDGLVESELFGHARGAFTGATSSRAGVFADADGGTLFLDEIGDMPLATQAKLLRVLQEGEVRAVGAGVPRKVDVRLVAATHQDLDAHLRSGRFRADLFYRLSVVPLVVPPLRERAADIALLAEHFLTRARARNPECRARRLADGVLAALAAHAWPGNVRELEHVIERLAILGHGAEVSVDELRAIAPELTALAPAAAPAAERLVTLRELEEEHIARVLAYCGANKARAAEILGVDPSTLYRRARRSAVPARAHAGDDGERQDRDDREPRHRARDVP